MTNSLLLDTVIKKVHNAMTTLVRNGVLKRTGRGLFTKVKT